MRRLWVHIGHDKTGSSYLQSVFARNLDMLRAAGIAYPVRPDLRETAAKGQTTSGTEHGPDLESRMAALPDGQDVLLSYEGFFNLLAEQPDAELGRWQDWCRTFGFDELHVLLFTRDPVAHAVSSYLQTVRWHGQTDPLDTYVLGYHRPLIVLRVLECLQAAPWVTSVTVRNYSRVRGRLTAEVLDWLPLPRDMAFAEDTGEVVNRGLSDTELALALRMNRRSPDRARAFAMRALLLFPEAESARAWPSLGAQEQVVAQNGDAMAMVNAQVPPEGQYSIDTRPPPERAVTGLEIATTLARMALGLARVRVGRIFGR